ncbi:MAG: oligoendopeptidase F [Clostridiales bacterium]|nr:oligoendopeptidase F [Clostridiales bacterium]
MKRNELKTEDTWRLEDLFLSLDDWENACKDLEERILKIPDFYGTLGQGVDSLYAYLSFQSDTEQLLERIYIYANLKYHEDTKNADSQKLTDRADYFMTAYNQADAFFVPELLSIPDEKLVQWVHMPVLADYEGYLLEIMRKKEHMLSKTEEELLAGVYEIANTPSTVFSMFDNADLKFPDVVKKDGTKLPLTHSTYMVYMKDEDQNIRRQAFQGLYHTYQAFENTLASLYAANVKQELFYAKTRKYGSSLEKALDSSQIPVSVYDNLIEMVEKHLKPMYKYMDIRRNALGLSKLHMYDIYVPFVKEREDTYTFDEAKQIVLEALKPMGEEYVGILEEGLSNRWIDCYENEGKRSGAYSWGAYGTHPYVLLNFQGRLNDVFTLAHEMGHAIHTYYSNQNQSYQNAGYKIFVAEVASTCNEALLMHYLLEHTNSEEKKACLVNYYLEQFRTTLFRQTMFAEFEQITHGKLQEGEALTAQNLKQIYHELNVKYYGPDVVIDDEIDMEWARIPHFYTPFYVYQYATGYSAAIALSSKILTEGAAAAKNYVDGFLKGGCSKTPLELLKNAGVDMSSKEPVEAALRVFEELVDKMGNLKG